MPSRFFEPPPPTGKTDYRRNLIFGMHNHLVHTAGPIEAIFDICPQDGVTGVDPGAPRGQKSAKNFFSIFHFFFIRVVRKEGLLPIITFISDK